MLCASILTYLKHYKHRLLTQGWCKTYSHVRTLQTYVCVPISKYRHLVASVLELTTPDRPRALLDGRAISRYETGQLLLPFALDSSNSTRNIDLLLHTEWLKESFTLLKDTLYPKVHLEWLQSLFHQYYCIFSASDQAVSTPTHSVTNYKNYTNLHHQNRHEQHEHRLLMSSGSRTILLCTNSLCKVCAEFSLAQEAFWTWQASCCTYAGCASLPRLALTRKSEVRILKRQVFKDFISTMF